MAAIDMNDFSTDQIIYNQAILDGIVRSGALGREVEIRIPE